MNRVSVSEQHVRLEQRRTGSHSARLQPGAAIAPLALPSIRSGLTRIPDSSRVTHLQFRRFAGCPVCDLHLQSFVARQHELVSVVREVIVFHSSREELLRYAGDLPFAVIADPGKELYSAFGVESAARSLLNPHAWLPIVKGVARSLGRTLRHEQSMPPLHPEGGSLGLPADFLIAQDGRIIASHYGVHAFDQWAVDEVLDLVNGEHRSTASDNVG